MKLYFRYMAIHFKCQLQYKASFFMTVAGQFLSAFSAFISIYLLMDRFHSVNEFSVNEVLLCFAIILLSFSAAECFVRGFDSFSSTISNGMFDRLLLMPRNEILTTLCSKMEFSKIGRFAQSVMIFCYAIPHCGVIWTAGRILLLIFMIISAIMLFSALFIIYASLCFFTTEGLEFMNIFTDGGREFGAYPMGIYGRRALRFFTYVVPLAMVQYYPFLYLTGKSDRSLYALCPLAAWAFMIPAAILWRIGLRHYKSTGS